MDLQNYVKPRTKNRLSDFTMRKCYNCDAWIKQDLYTCPYCQATDYGWIDHCETLKRNFHRKSNYMEQIKANMSIPNQQYKIRLSPFSDSGELGYHLFRIKQLLLTNKNVVVDVILNAESWEFDWDYGYDSEPERDIYLPPSLPLPSLVEVSRFVYSLLDLDKTRINIQFILPPKKHAATNFIESTGLFSILSESNISYSNNPAQPSSRQGCDDVLVPVTYVGPTTGGQLSVEFHKNFERLAEAGFFKNEYRTAIRKVIMEAAENADNWGGGGWVCCFLRQEKRGVGNFGNLEQNFIPAKHTHLFLHVFSIGPSLAQTMNQEDEWEAINLITTGYSAREINGGRGIPIILDAVLNSAWGTISISSEAYTRIITPDGLTREYYSAGSDYLPGVHICAVIPLAIISDIQDAMRVRV